MADDLLVEIVPVPRGDIVAIEGSTRGNPLNFVTQSGSIVGEEDGKIVFPDGLFNEDGFLVGRDSENGITLADEAGEVDVHVGVGAKVFQDSTTRIAAS